jgi:hypothetical protein
MIEGNYHGFDVERRDTGIALVTFRRPERLNAIGAYGANTNGDQDSRTVGLAQADLH